MCSAADSHDRACVLQRTRVFVADHFQYSPACEPVVASFAELLTRHIVAERKCFALAAVQCSPHFVRKLLQLWMLGLEEVVLEVSCIEWIGIILPECQKMYCMVLGKTFLVGTPILVAAANLVRRKCTCNQLHKCQGKYTSVKCLI